MGGSKAISVCILKGLLELPGEARFGQGGGGGGGRAPPCECTPVKVML